MSSVKVRFHTNLDLHHSETWPTELPCRPMVGDLVQSEMAWGKNKVRLELRVRAIRFIPVVGLHGIVTGTELVAELGLSSWHSSIYEFQKWYAAMQKEFINL